MTTPLKARIVFIRSAGCRVSGGRNPEDPLNKLLNFRMARSPSPQPSPQGEGVTIGRRPVEAPRVLLGLVRLLPLLGERVGVRGNGASNISPRSVPASVLTLARRPVEAPRVLLGLARLLPLLGERVGV